MDQLAILHTLAVCRGRAPMRTGEAPRGAGRTYE
jgi:hypothetical protein